MPSIFPNDYRKMIEALVRSRKAKRITQVQLAEAMQVPQSFISKAERGERRLDAIELLRICELLGVSITDVLISMPTRFMPVADNAKG